MHRLARQVRFSVNPFRDDDKQGFNSYASKPCGEGLSIYFGLWVEVVGRVNDDTGFVVNVADIDSCVRESVVPLFADCVGTAFRAAKEISTGQLGGLLKKALVLIDKKLRNAAASKIGLELNPFRRIDVKAENADMLCFSEKFEFAAMHTLWNDNFSKERNLQLFGKCANPAGHGHNYIVEVTVEIPFEEDMSVEKFQYIVNKELISIVDHRNLNIDVAQFRQKNPTVENIAEFAWSQLAGKFGKNRLISVTVWENDRTYCTVAE